MPIEGDGFLDNDTIPYKKNPNTILSMDNRGGGNNTNNQGTNSSGQGTSSSGQGEGNNTNNQGTGNPNEDRNPYNGLPDKSNQGRNPYIDGNYGDIAIAPSPSLSVVEPEVMHGPIPGPEPFTRSMTTGPHTSFPDNPKKPVVPELVPKCRPRANVPERTRHPLNPFTAGTFKSGPIRAGSEYVGPTTRGPNIPGANILGSATR